MSALTRRQQIELQLWIATIAARPAGAITDQAAMIRQIAGDILRVKTPAISPRTQSQSELQRGLSANVETYFDRVDQTVGLGPERGWHR